MNHEVRINEALRQLGEEHRLGMVQLEEYKARRRLLIEAWYEKDVTTSPGSLRKAGFGTIPPGQKRALGAPSSVPKVVLVGLGVVVAVIVSAWFTFKPRSTAAPVVPAQAPPSAQVLAVRKAAENFLAVNAWEAQAVEAVLTQWRQLSPEERVRALEEPAVRTLRFKLDQNIQAEAQLVAPDAPPEERQRLDLLTKFAEELDA